MDAEQHVVSVVIPPRRHHRHAAPHVPRLAFSSLADEEPKEAPRSAGGFPGDPPRISDCGARCGLPGEPCVGPELSTPVIAPAARGQTERPAGVVDTLTV